MIRTVAITVFLLMTTFSSWSQMCPGGGVDFNSAVMFDPAWIYGCATGTSCNGGVVLDNRLSCEPVTAMDACAPQPSCGVAANNASDIWFKFYPTYSNVTLACVQNTSLVIGIQAFEGSACGSLSELGCALAGGPSSGVQLTLNGLQPGQLYYFRIFGSSNSTPQRTGLYCFCGTVGVQAIILPASLESLKAVVRDKKIELSFQKPSPDDNGFYEIEYSTDGRTFESIYQLTNGNAASTANKIIYRHSPHKNGLSYYRLKRSALNSRHYHSAIVKVTLQAKTINIAHNGLKGQITVEVFERATVHVSDLSGRILLSVTLNPGRHHISISKLLSGIYLLYNNEDKQTHKFVVSK
jgi:hypothetical protein